MSQPPQFPENPDDPGRSHPRPSPGGGRPQDPYGQYPPDPHVAGQHAQDPNAPAGYPQGGYPGGGYPADPYAAPAPAGSGGLRLSERLGARLPRRPEPRFGVALAGIGVLLVIFGVVTWGGDYLTSGGSGGGFGGGGGGGSSDSHKVLGIGLSLAVVIAGYALAITRRTGPLANAGVAASALGIPVFVGFLSYERSGSALPISSNAIAIVSMLVWLGSYLFVRGARGHVFYLGATVLTLWLYLLDKIEPHLFSAAIFLPVFVIRGALGPTDGLSSFPAGPDFTTVSAVCLVFGLAYYLTALGLDRSGRSGMAVAFALGGFFATVAGIIAAAVDLPQAGTGVLLIVLGALLGAYGGHTRRRFTTWAWAFAVAVGIILILAKVIPDNTTGAGISMIVIGAALVALAPLLGALLREPDETVVSPAAGATSGSA